MLPAGVATSVPGVRRIDEPGKSPLFTNVGADGQSGTTPQPAAPSVRVVARADAITGSYRLTATVPGAAASRTAEPPKTPEVARPKPAPEAVARATPTPPAAARPVSLPKIELTSRGSTAQSAGPAPAAEPWRPQGGAGGTWAVQVGSFGVEENANLLRDRLRSQRFPAVVERIRGGSQTMYRVRVVGQDSRPASEAMATRLRSAGVAANIVEPGE